MTEALPIYMEDILGSYEQSESAAPTYPGGIHFENPFADWLFGGMGAKTQGERLMALRRD